MSTRDIAYSIFEQFGEEELQGFIALFSKAYPPKHDDTAEHGIEIKANALSEQRAES